MTKRIELHSCHNDDCEKLCTKERRQKLTDDSICLVANSKKDGLPVRCVGSWAYDKIYFLTRYFEIFSVGMKDRWHNNLAYFEICSGPGRCIDRRSGEEMDGTPLAILNNRGFQYIKKAYFLDIKQEVVDSLNRRINALKLEHKAQAVYGNYEDGDAISALISQINPEGLNLVFIDPTDCSVPFETLEKITKNRSTDIILNVAVWTDLNRNLIQAILNPDFESRNKYKNFLGDPSFFTDPHIIELANNGLTTDLRTLYMKKYRLQLNKLGLKFVAEKEINGYYNLVFASGNNRGIEFWHKAADSIQPNGQKSFLFE